jgi:TPP-dependent pyruvate/acetoin dehydrogenase alpha subunit
MAAHTTEAGVARADLLDSYRTMLRIRLAEMAIIRMRLAGTVVGSVHLEMSARSRTWWTAFPSGACRQPTT